MKVEAKDTVFEDKITHCVWLPRFVVQRLLFSMDQFQRATARDDLADQCHLRTAYLRAALSTSRFDSIELRGTVRWFLDLCTLSRDTHAAFEIGRQMQGGI